MKKSVDYTIRKLDEETLPDLIPLYKEVFGKRTDEVYLTKKYDTSYLGVSLFGHLAYDLDGRPIAFHGAVPFQMQYRGRAELGAQYGDAMTLKSWAGRGLFTILGQLTDRALVAAGVHFSWGFPNQNSEYGYLNKMHWTGVERMHGFTIPVATAPMEKLSRTVHLGGAFQQRIRQSLQHLIVADAVMPNSALTDDEVVCERNRQFYHYKSFTNNFVIEIADCRFWIKPEGGLLIGDISVEDEDHVLAALDELKTLARAHGLTKITFQASPGTHHERIFAKRFPAFDSWLLGYRSFNSSFPLERMKCTYGDLDTF